jgi:DNA-directed RNA polymerase omega subunit
MPTPIEKLVVIDQIMKKVENRYEAVRVIAREARRLNSLIIRGAEVDDDFKATSTAMQRLIDDKIQYEFVERKEEPDDLFSE